MLKASLLVFLGSGAGGVLRMLLAGVVNLKLQKSMAFPIGIFTVNLLGCLLMGIGYAYFKQRIALSEMQILLLQGVLGGFTTFSAFGIETFSFLQQGLIYQAVLYISLTVVGGLLTLSLAHLLTTGFLSK